MPGINRIELSRYVYAGPGVIKELPNVLNDLGYSRGNIIIISGPTKTYEIAYDIVSPILKSYDYKVYIKPLPRITKIKDLDVKALISLLKSEKPNVILGLGGGSIIDVVKVISALTNISYLSVPTSASHDGTASPAIGTPLRRALRVMGLNVPAIRTPHAIIADINIISKAPKESIASGVGDVISKFTATRDWWLAHMIKGEEYSEYAASLSLMSARLVASKADLIAKRSDEGVANLVKALIGAGVAISIAGNSRPASGSEHLFSHALDFLAEKYGFKSSMHGMQCGVGSIIMAKLHGFKWRKLRNILKKVGAPISAQELGISPKYVIEALTIAHKMKDNYYTILGESGLTRNAAIKLALETGVISEKDANML